MDSSDWSKGIRYHIFDTRPDTECKLQALPGATGRYQALPGATGRYRALPGATGRYRALPGGFNTGFNLQNPTMSSPVSAIARFAAISSVVFSARAADVS